MDKESKLNINSIFMWGIFVLLLSTIVYSFYKDRGWTKEWVYEDGGYLTEFDKVIGDTCPAARSCGEIKSNYNAQVYECNCTESGQSFKMIGTVRRQIQRYTYEAD